MTSPPRGEKEVVTALREAGLNPAVTRFPESMESAAASARRLGVEAARIVKSMVIQAGREPVLVLIPGDRRADIRAVAGIVGAERVRLADRKAVLEWTGFPVGAVPPVGHRRPLPVLMDEAIPSEGSIFPSAGESNNAYETTFEDLCAVTGARVCAISRGS